MTAAGHSIELQQLNTNKKKKKKKASNERDLSESLKPINDHIGDWQEPL